MTFEEWERLYPHAARDLRLVVNAIPKPEPTEAKTSEAAAQQAIRMKVASMGAYAWRNNRGATPSKCPECGYRQRPVRYGIANDSEKLDKIIKSSDLLLSIPKVITRAMVGSVIPQIGWVECKPPGWSYKATEREKGQAKWLEFQQSTGAYAKFATKPEDVEDLFL